MPAVAPDGSSRWVVLKFGGTSVAKAERWAVIAEQVKRVLAAGERPFVVVSAVSQVTNRLNRCIEEAIAKGSAQGSDKAGEQSSYEWIHATHMQLAAELGVDKDEAGMRPLQELLEELKRLLDGIALTCEASARLNARINAFGELMSSQLGVLALRAHGCNCTRLDARRLLRSTETLAQQDVDRYLNANVNPKKDVELFHSELVASSGDRGAASQPSMAVITQGYIGATPRGDTCLLGRGGSDTSGALLAALVGAVRLEIWTDVHGLFTSDPRHVKNTRLICKTSYRVAQELASMGAKVLHPRCLVPAQYAGIPVEVHNTQDPHGPCTRIAEPDSEQVLRKNPQILAVTQRRGQVLLNITNLSMWGEAGFLSKVFAPFGELDVSVDLVATSQYAVSLTLDHIPGGVKGEVFGRLLERLSLLGQVTRHDSCSVVSVVGECLRTALPRLSTALGQSLEELSQCDVHLMTQSSEDLNLSWVVDEAQATALVQGLHNRLFPSSPDENAGALFGGTWEALHREGGVKRESYEVPHRPAKRARSPS